MAKPFDRVVTPNQYSSAGHVHSNADRNEALVSHVRSLSQWINAFQVDAASITALTDNSLGAAGATMASDDSGVFTLTDVSGGILGVTPASADTAADSVMTAYATLVEQANLVIDEIWGTGAAFEADEGPGTGGSGTIAAVDDTATANADDDTAASHASAIVVQRDLLHAQRMVANLIDDLSEACGLARVLFPPGHGVYGFVATDTLVFATGPDTITRTSGSFVTDGFQPGDKILVAGTTDNNLETTILSLSATVLTTDTGVTLTAESLTAGEAEVASIRTLSRSFPGRLGGADTLDIDGSTTSAGSDWTFEFETGTSAISNFALDVNPPEQAVLLTEWDAFVDQLADNIALMADQLDLVTNVAADTAVGVAAGR